MFVSSIFAGAIALLAVQADPSSQARDAYTACLQKFMEKSAEDKMSVSAFESALAQQCTEQERAFRAAVRVREASYKTPAAEVEELTQMEIDDARSNYKQLFEMRVTPR